MLGMHRSNADLRWYRMNTLLQWIVEQESLSWANREDNVRHKYVQVLNSHGMMLIVKYMIEIDLTLRVYTATRRVQQSILSLLETLENIFKILAVCVFEKHVSSIFKLAKNNKRGKARTNTSKRHKSRDNYFQWKQSKQWVKNLAL